jgi:hypothetical protein
MNQFVCGWIGGAAGVVVSHPLDTIRVRVQLSKNPNIAMLDVLRSTIAREGVQGLFKGLYTPVVCVGLWKSLIFCGHSAVVHESDDRASSQFIGGMAGGTLGLVVVVPMENIKCRAQAQKHRSTNALEYQLARTIFRESGFAGLYRGLALMAPGCIGSMGIWFGTNSLLKKSWLGDEQATFVQSFLCGSLSGAISWVYCYPFDKLKTIWQCEPNAQDAVKLLGGRLRAEGPSFLYRGLGPTIVRSLPQCGATMAAYDYAARVLF